MFPSEKIKNKKLITIIKQITSYTAVIYCIHFKVSEHICNYIIIIKKRTVKGCIIIYLISYLIRNIDFWKNNVKTFIYLRRE